MRTTKLVLALAASLALGGCESAPLSPRGEGEVRVGVQGSGAAESGGSRSLSGSEGGSAEASVEVQARVYLRTSAGEWVEVTRAPARQTVRADGSDGVRAFATGEVASGTYGRVRVEFEEVRARPAGGVWIGLPLEGEVTVEIGGSGRLVVEREIEVRVRRGAQAHLTMNLNADAWLKQADRTRRTVAAASFAGAVAITGG